jgi:hypothetical protein
MEDSSRAQQTTDCAGSFDEIMGLLTTYLKGLGDIHATGEAVEETSYYGQLEALLNAAGKTLTPQVCCVLTTKNRGAGIPDGGLFVAGQAVASAGDSAMLARSPERGVVEVKGPGQDAPHVAHSAQVKRYLDRYGKVLVTTYRDFLVVSLDKNGKATEGERFTLAAYENAFWALVAKPSTAEAKEADFEQFLCRALLGDAPLSRPEDLAWFLAAYARTALKRIEDAGEMAELATLRHALEEALGLRFEGEDGDHFFRSALVQTLFYGVFAAWVFWHETEPLNTQNRFHWKQAQWTLNVPMVRALFERLATPSNLPTNLSEILDWTDDVLGRVNRELFFTRFEAAEAVQYFYEPFLREYDPELRRVLGVWYTPPEVVTYIVEQVHEALKAELNIPLGLADSNVYILDPCVGTGSFLTAVLNVIVRTLEEEGGNGLVASEAKQAALSRVYGFELLPAPFVIAHLQIGMLLQKLGVPLDGSKHERASVYLTNSLTGWTEGDSHPHLPIEEFEVERDAATTVKQDRTILVVLGNPPYNGFSGVSGEEEGGLVDKYKEGLSSKWDITKNKLDDLYVRFFSVGERRIAEQTGQGIVCFISNFSWLGDPSTVVMREHILGSFDSITVDCLNGDSRETGKKTPSGAPDPSVFSTRLNPPGIQVGTAISMLVRRADHDDDKTTVRYRDFWGQTKREQLLSAIEHPQETPEYAELKPNVDNWYRLRPWSPREGYEEWPAVNELCDENPILGLNENRSEALVDANADSLLERISTYLDKDVPLSGVDWRLRHDWSEWDPKAVRKTLLEHGIDEDQVVRFLVRAFDLRYAYIETRAKLWNRARPPLVRAAKTNSPFLLARRRAPRALDGAAFLFTRCLVDQHSMHKDAYVIPFWLGPKSTKGDKAEAAKLFEEVPAGGAEWRPNLSKRAVEYLDGLGIANAESDQTVASLIWQHVLAIGYSPLYLEENGDAVRSQWPRVPLPASEEQLRASAQLGDRIAKLLDLDEVLPGVDTGPISYLQPVGRITAVDGGTVNPDKGDLSVNVGWGRTQKDGAVMAAAGHLERRKRTDEDNSGLTAEQSELLGNEVLDIFLNARVCWAGVPAAAWDYKIGGFPVLRKWLSYRDEKVLRRPLTTDEARSFVLMVRRLTELALLEPQLDENYKAAREATAES